MDLEPDHRDDTHSGPHSMQHPVDPPDQLLDPVFGRSWFQCHWQSGQRQTGIKFLLSIRPDESNLMGTFPESDQRHAPFSS